MLTIGWLTLIFYDTLPSMIFIFSSSVVLSSPSITSSTRYKECIIEPRHEKTSDTNWAVQPQKLARIFNFVHSAVYILLLVL